MKKVLSVFIIAIVLSIGTTSAQGFYVKAGAGYNFPLTKTFYQDQVITNTGAKISANFVGVNLSKGFAPTLGLGYMFSKHVGFELGAIYTLGSDNVVNTTVMAGTATALTSKQIIHSKSLVLYPSIKLQTGIRGMERVKLYSRASLVLPIAGYTSNKFNIDTLLPKAGTTRIEAKIHGNPTLGLAAALGIDIKVAKKLSVWGEVNGQSLKVWAKKSEITKYDRNGTSILAVLPVYQKQTNYVNTLNSSSNNSLYKTPDQTKPMDDIKSKEANFDAVGISVGLSFRF